MRVLDQKVTIYFVFQEPTVIVRSLTNLKETEPGGQKEPVKVINNEIPLQDTKIHQELNKLREKIEDLANKLKVSEKEGELLESNLELKEKELQEAVKRFLVTFIVGYICPEMTISVRLHLPCAAFYQSNDLIL